MICPVPIPQDGEKQMPALTAFFDGACGPINPGGHVGYGAIIYRDGTKLWECSKRYIPETGREIETSNNLAEYLAFFETIQYIFHMQFDDLEAKIYGDSKLVVEQMSGRWKIKSGVYVEIALQAQKVLAKLERTPRIIWIPREQNTIADALSKAPIARLSR
jgi:ribonuclease HI